VGKMKGKLVYRPAGLSHINDFTPEGLGGATKTIEHFLAPAVQLYEQEPGEPCGSSRLGLYVKLVAI
jgi:hypothetical protein